MTKRRVYISGPITGMPDRNKPLFQRVENALLQTGAEVVNPHKLPHKPDATWEEHMRVDLAALLTCNTLVLLQGWEDSKGALFEASVAVELKMSIGFVVNLFDPDERPLAAAREEVAAAIARWKANPT